MLADIAADALADAPEQPVELLLAHQRRRRAALRGAAAGGAIATAGVLLLTTSTPAGWRDGTGDGDGATGSATVAPSDGADRPAGGDGTGPPH